MIEVKAGRTAAMSTRPVPRSCGTLTVKAVNHAIATRTLTVALAYRCPWRISEDEVKSATIAGLDLFSQMARDRGLGTIKLGGDPGLIPHRDGMGVDLVIEGRGAWMPRT